MPGLGAVRGRVRRAALGEAIAAFRRLPVDPDLVLHESFAGNGMLCNPEALYRRLRADQRYAHLRHVWVLDDPAAHPTVLAELAQDPRVQVVARRSTAYFRALSTAGWLVNNATFPAEFGKRPEQVYVNTWHGMPLKRMGYDIPGGIPGARNVVRNLLQADVLLSASPTMTETLYASAYKLRNAFRGRVLEEGYPRMDRQHVGAEHARALLAAHGTPVASERVVLLAPTWRGSDFQDPRDDSAALAAQVATLRAALGPGWTVLLKVHQAVARAARAHPDLREALVEHDLPANVVLAAADVLVADYSSILVDFLALDRPLVLLAPDRDTYDAERGRYAPLPGSPGPVVDTVAEVAALVAAVGTGAADDPQVTHGAIRRAWCDHLCPHEDGHASQRVIDAVWGRAPGAHWVDLASDGRPRVLVYVGELKPNGMTTSARNLLGALDHARVDVTAVYSHSPDHEQAAVLATLPPAVRAVGRFGAINGSRATQAARHAVQQGGIPRRAAAPPLAGMFADEWQRCFGSARFDSVVDFIGYGAFMDLLLLAAPPDPDGRAPHRAIWQHNDMVADAHRDVAGRTPLRRRLGAVFSTYRFFDHLVSVSPALRDVNRDRLAGYAPAERFTYAQNVIDAAGVRSRAADPAGWCPPAAPGVVTFVAAGRLSSAKNFPRLVSAYARVRSEFPDTRVVILGDGEARAELSALVGSLGLDGQVLLAGHHANPFPAMAAADCFVLSSDHEGQPMVILEALALGLPVVSTAFASVASALPAGQGLVVERSVEGLAEGLRAFLRGDVPAPAFDAEAYNRAALAQFLAAVGLPHLADP